MTAFARCQQLRDEIVLILSEHLVTETRSELLSLIKTMGEEQLEAFRRRAIQAVGQNDQIIALMSQPDYLEEILSELRGSPVDLMVCVDLCELDCCSFVDLEASPDVDDVPALEAELIG